MNFTVGGYWDSEIAMVPAFIVKRCDKYTESKYNITCIAENEMQKLIPSAYLKILYMSNMIYPQSFDDYYKTNYPILFNSYNYVSYETHAYEIIYNKAVLTTDAGVIFEDTSDASFFEVIYKSWKA